MREAEGRGALREVSSTIALLRVIGSPFAYECEPPESKRECLRLYEHAVKNKVGLLYLERLSEMDMLDSLEQKHREERDRHREQLLTAIRVCELLSSHGARYALFKSIMPFPATPNDVDVVHFGSDEEYDRIAEVLLRSGYVEVKGHTDSSQRMFHDARVCEHAHPDRKDVYDVDIYHKVAASYLVYLDRKKLERCVVEERVSGGRIRMLTPEAELVAIITHSILPEQLFTAFAYYPALYYLAKMSPREIRRFVGMAEESAVKTAVRAHLSLTAQLHETAHGFVPEEVNRVLEVVGKDKGEVDRLLRNDMNTPHRYSLWTLFRLLVEKCKEGEFRRSVVDQMVHMTDPTLLRWVIGNIIWRRRRKTY
ncbi:MAG: hypothetical protein PWR26_1240 [Methanosarcinales archaeon]|nr:hypothetical protein [Methanosarcinales archaeon]